MLTTVEFIVFAVIGTLGLLLQYAIFRRGQTLTINVGANVPPGVVVIYDGNDILVRPGANDYRLAPDDCR